MDTALIIYEHHTGDKTPCIVKFNGEPVPLPVGKVIEVPAELAAKWTAWPAQGGIYGMRYADQKAQTDPQDYTRIQATGQTLREHKAALKAAQDAATHQAATFDYFKLVGDHGESDVAAQTPPDEGGDDELEAPAP